MSTPLIAVAGNPNCGKTTVFNALTGLRYKVANYPGVTVEKKFGSVHLPDLDSATIVDLPGIYSLSGMSIDEQIAADALLGSRNEPVPDCVLIVLDASNLERNLFLTSQILDLRIPVVLGLNMVDIAEERGIKIYTELLEKELDCPIVKLVAAKGIGFDELRAALSKAIASHRVSTKSDSWKNEAAPSSEHSAGIMIDSSTEEATNRYEWAHRLLKRCIKYETPASRNRLWQKFDSLLTHRFWGYLIFLFIFGALFQGIFTFAEVPMRLMESSVAAVGATLDQLLPDGPFKSLIVDGILAGVGNVLIFVPQIAILFFLLALLEDSGYLARAAFLMDRIMRPLGLQGRSFIPLLSSFACAIPGILSTRTIPSFADRMTTIMIAPLMSCSARLPVYTVLISAFIPDSRVLGFMSLRGLTMLGMYLLGIAAAAITGRIFKLTAFRGKPAIFVMEIPTVRMPLIRSALREAYDRALTFINSAGTTILFCSVVLWFLASYPTPPTGYTGSRVEYSIAGKIGKTIEPVIKPLGFNWEMGVGILASFAAREVFVSTLATVYRLQDTDPDSQSLILTLQDKKAAGTFSTVSALSLMIFFVFACQCMSTLAVTRRETGGWFWPGVMFSYMTLLAYAASLTFYTIFA